MATYVGRTGSGVGWAWFLHSFYFESVPSEVLTRQIFLQVDATTVGLNSGQPAYSARVLYPCRNRKGGAEVFLFPW